MLAGLGVQPAHPLGQWQLLAPEMAFLVLATGPAPARLISAEVGARLGPVLLQQLHQRMVRLGAGTAQQRQPALDVTAIRGDAGQIEQRQRPFRIHRLGGQQLAFGRVDVADPLQRHRAQPAKRHPRRARHLRLQHLGEHAQRGGPGAPGADRLGQQQLSQQRVGKCGPQLTHQIGELVDLGPVAPSPAAVNASSGGSSASAASISSATSGRTV